MLDECTTMLVIFWSVHHRTLYIWLNENVLSMCPLTIHGKYPLCQKKLREFPGAFYVVPVVGCFCFISPSRLSVFYR